ncbi:MAG: polysaccharide deacetylase family protein [Vicinamibacterales bacterium]
MRIARALVMIAASLTLASAQQAPPDSHAPVGVVEGDTLARLGVTPADVRLAEVNPSVRYSGLTKFVDRTRTAVTGTFDDSNRAVLKTIDTLDAYGIKATLAISTQSGAIAELWPRLGAAVANGHEIGSHARRHLCQWPDTETFCRSAYSRDEVEGSRDDIVARTGQRYVWTWVYPCGNCADYEFVHERLRRAGYLVARTYPDERRGGHIVPDLQSWAADPYRAAYTQVVQRQGGIAPAGRTDVALLNRKFDDIHPALTEEGGRQGAGGGRGRGAAPSAEGGIYHLVSHPSLLDFGQEQFFEKHLAYIGNRPDVWYVPLGPLYAYQIVRENTVVTPLGPKQGWERFAVHNTLDPKVYDNVVTLTFVVPAASAVSVRVGGRAVQEKTSKLTDRWNVEYYRRDDTSTFVTVRPNQIVEVRVVE